MNNCLNISEILAQIFSYTDDRTLARLARTCHAFQDPALNHLWSKLQTLSPLIRVMPSDLWQEEIIVSETRLCLRRPILSSDWTRFCYYSHRVRELCYPFYTSPLTSGGMQTGDFHAFDKAAPPTLFPNLSALVIGSLVGNIGTLRLNIWPDESIELYTLLLQMLRSIPARHLIMISPYSMDGRMESSWKALFETIQRGCSSTTLTNMYSSSFMQLAEFEPASSRSLTISTLRPLLGFRNLRQLFLNLSIGFDLGDKELEEIALSFHHLTSLFLSGTFGWRVPSRVTLHGLVLLLKHCPDLEHLGLPIDTRKTGRGLLQGPNSRVSNTNIHIIFLANSPIGDPESIAAFLLDVLPNISGISAWQGKMRGWATPEVAKVYSARWARVADAIRARD